MSCYSTTMSDFTINFRTLRETIVCEEADAPNVITVVTPSVPRGQQSTAGPIHNPAKAHRYVRLEALPKELAERVRVAIEAASWG